MMFNVICISKIKVIYSDHQKLLQYMRLEWLTLTSFGFLPAYLLFTGVYFKLGDESEITKFWWSLALLLGFMRLLHMLSKTKRFGPIILIVILTVSDIKKLLLRCIHNLK